LMNMLSRNLEWNHSSFRRRINLLLSIRVFFWIIRGLIIVFFELFLVVNAFQFSLHSQLSMNCVFQRTELWWQFGFRIHHNTAFVTVPVSPAFLCNRVLPFAESNAVRFWNVFRWRVLLFRHHAAGRLTVAPFTDARLWGSSIFYSRCKSSLLDIFGNVSHYPNFEFTEILDCNKLRTVLFKGVLHWRIFLFHSQ
jgi:hypothetical protein